MRSLPYELHQLWDIETRWFQLLPSVETRKNWTSIIEADLVRQERHASTRVHEGSLYWAWNLSRLTFDTTARIGGNQLLPYKHADRPRVIRRMKNGPQGMRCLKLQPNIAPIAVTFHQVN